MLILHADTGAAVVATPKLSGKKLPHGVVWIDLLGGSEEERHFVERATGLRVPTFERLQEIESSSRLAVEDGILYLSTPVIYRSESNEPLTTPLGFVLSP